MAEKSRRLLGLPFVLLFTVIMTGSELGTTEEPDYLKLALKAAVTIVLCWGLIKFFDRFAGRAEPKSPPDSRSH